MGRLFEMGPETVLRYNLSALRRIACVYEKAIAFITEVYYSCLLPSADELNFEVSIDETLTVTSPLAHCYVANELKIRGVRFATIAPRFSGEFQKGIDYIGDINTFAQEVRTHNDVAKYYGYKLSFHSGSDKFSVFSEIAQGTQGHFHVKTSGTSWLEALRVIAKYAPPFFRVIYKVACDSFEENQKFYHVTPDLSTLPKLETLSDSALPGLLDEVAPRQVLHIAYGKILEGASLRKALFDTLEKYQQEYSDALYSHIGRHMQSLEIPHGGSAR